VQQQLRHHARRDAQSQVDHSGSKPVGPMRLLLMAQSST
jgi:hypothetical protein